MRSTLLLILLLPILGLFATATGARGDDGWRPSHLGARYGYSVTNDEHTFDQVELFAHWPLLGWQGERWTVFTLGLEGFAGVLWSHEESAFIGGAGPVFRIWPVRLVALEGGFRVAYLSEYHFVEYPYTDFGGPIQFVSHGGLVVQPASRLEISARFQHMSNGEIYEGNSGLNMLMVGLGWRF
jgi:hypothetical protein